MYNYKIFYHSDHKNPWVWGGIKEIYTIAQYYLRRTDVQRVEITVE